MCRGSHPVEAHCAGAATGEKNHIGGTLLKAGGVAGKHKCGPQVRNPINRIPGQI